MNREQKTLIGYIGVKIVSIAVLTSLIEWAFPAFQATWFVIGFLASMIHTLYVELKQAEQLISVD